MVSWLHCFLAVVTQETVLDSVWPWWLGSRDETEGGRQAVQRHTSTGHLSHVPSYFESIKRLISIRPCPQHPLTLPVPQSLSFGNTNPTYELPNIYKTPPLQTRTNVFPSQREGNSPAHVQRCTQMSWKICFSRQNCFLLGVFQYLPFCVQPQRPVSQESIQSLACLINKVVLGSGHIHSVMCCECLFLRYDHRIEEL